MPSTHDQTIIQFAAALANQHQRNLDIIHPRARVIITGPFATNDTLSLSGMVREWLKMGEAAANTLTKTPGEVTRIRHITKSFLEFVFSFPGHIATEPPAAFHDTPMGRVWNQARVWCEDDLMTVSEAAAMVGVSVPAIGQNKNLTLYYDTTQANKQRGYRLVSRCEVLEHYKERMNQ